MPFPVHLLWYHVVEKNGIICVHCSCRTKTPVAIDCDLGKKMPHFIQGPKRQCLEPM